MGTPAYVRPVLEAAERLAANHDGEIVGVYSAPDRPVGRGKKVAPSPIKELALAKGYQVLTPTRLRPAEEVARFEALHPEIVVLAAYGLILPAPVLFGPKHGAVNVHPSLLPRHRGASPVAAAILAGDEVTGTTIIKMDEGLDTGDIIRRAEVGLDGAERTPELTDRLFKLGGLLLDECLPAYLRGDLELYAQPDESVTVVKRFAKEDGILDWTRSAIELERRIRAFDPWPGTATTWQGERLDILEARVGSACDGAPGSVFLLGKEIGIATGEGSLVLDQVRPAGRKTMDARAFANGHPGFVGGVVPS